MAGTADARQRAASLVSLLRRSGRWRAFWATTRTDHRVVAPWLEKVGCPSFVIMGRADPDWRDPVAEAAWAARAVGEDSGEVMMVPGAGHAPMLERPDVVGPCVVDFSRRIVADNAAPRPAGGRGKESKMPRAGLSTERRGGAGGADRRCRRTRDAVPEPSGRRSRSRTPEPVQARCRYE